MAPRVVTLRVVGVSDPSRGLHRELWSEHVAYCFRPTLAEYLLHNTNLICYDRVVHIFLMTTAIL